MELYYNGNMDWNMDISEITSNGTYYFSGVMIIKKWVLNLSRRRKLKLRF